ncbi:MAG TPA: hypothetical protein VNU19_04660 [Candidatus Acidoferrum sp.]|nr:hypothetical protein [Candidatus Acidoferrum sp.]
MSPNRRTQSGQVMVLVAVALLALIGTAALVLLAGSDEWQKNQLQELADSTALDSALKIGVSCDAPKATAIITEADNFLATRRTRTGSLTVTAGTCANPYVGNDTFAGGLTAKITYPYRAHQQQVEVILTLTLPISFGAEVGSTSTTVVRRAVAQALEGSTAAISATNLTCASGQVNAAGSVRVQNLITISGTCALYAHARLDAASGTYSDLGNASVYADSQSWVGAGGTCTAGSSSGSVKAICADGVEVTGHVTPTCGTSGTSANLSAGVVAVNPNPCAAGVAPQPVPSVSTALPPEPNTDASAIATLQGTGGAACTSGAAYPNIVAGGATVATGLGPVPLKDASGFYHFKPSCYGYLNVGALGGGISNVQIGAETAVVRHLITPTLTNPSTAGTLLVAIVRSDDTPNRFLAPAGWVTADFASVAGTARTEIWYYPNNPGGISSVTFTITPANIDTVAQMSEWRNVAAVVPITGTQVVASNQLTGTVSTSAATPVANELVITAEGFNENAAQTINLGASWNTLANDATNGFGSAYRLDLPAAVASETASSTVATTWSMVIAAFKPAAAAPGSAVLDPGFYYFNGSGFAGGGGICLNGGTLLARDTTLEFVNQAGFSSGDCTPGGGAACSGTCQLGSTPCSLSACPPNVAADSPSNLTWFAAPCNLAPAGDSAACPGSAWCPVGDRACWNLLVWAPATNTGQLAINGAAVSHWLLGSVYWPGTCTDSVNGTSTIAGTLSCGTLSISAGAGAGTAAGGDFGINTALVEAVLVE